LAVMVSFAEDRDGTTFGNGKFGSIYTQNYGNDILDPLPHDINYFNSHFQFVKNYFDKVSNGNLNVVYTILQDTFSVSQTMRNYSPSPGSNDFTPMGIFATEVWTKADQMNPGFDFSNYDLFTILHAGVGRDVSLPGSIGNERDLPSVYLSSKAFKEIYGENYEGIPVSGGSFNITNSMIIPETESRELESVTGSFLFEITINGLLCASVGSYLGLPDLFDTETGLSAIGRFGLMDGQGIFAYSGTYPPEPSPWSKIFLSEKFNWNLPVVTLPPGNYDVSLVTSIAAGVPDTVILKVPLNSTEYFLVENRNRDANNDGSKITYMLGGSSFTKTYINDTTGYESFDVSDLAGVITDVDEFDWAVPGNGIVIWHIDENVINEKIDENKINTDKNRRGVDIEEADGIQDIGERFFDIFGNEVIGEGTEEDFWHRNNPADFYENIFSKDTRPDTRTNSGANSLITIKNFSVIGNRMGFRVEYGDSVIKPLFSKDLNLNNQQVALSVSADNENYNILTLSQLNIINSDTTSLPGFSKFKTPSIVFENTLYTYGVVDSFLNVYITDDNSSYLGSSNVHNMISSPPVIRISDTGEQEVVFGTENGKVLVYDLGSLPSVDPTEKAVYDVSPNISTIKKVSTIGSYYAVIGDPLNRPGGAVQLYFDSDGNSYSFTDETPVDIATTINKDGNNVSVVLTSANRFYIFNSGKFNNSFNVSTSTQINSFALADLKNDGSNYIVINNGNNIEAYNLTGALADYFPSSDPEGIGFINTPLTADFYGNGNSEIISLTTDGRIFAIDGGTGKVVPGFPISSGSGINVAPVMYNSNGKTNLVVLNDQDVLSGWSISSSNGRLFWAEENGNYMNSSFISSAENIREITEFFPTARAYNYPNPVYDGTTFIRYYVSEDSKINIKIFDLAGDFVAELNDDASGGMDNETTWNVGDVQSGVYLARIEASGTSGKTEHAIIKIAVVK